MDDREKRTKSDRVMLEFSIVAAILFIIVFVGGNLRLVESSNTLRNTLARSVR
jgi:hypothetical protein